MNLPSLPIQSGPLSPPVEGRGQGEGSPARFIVPMQVPKRKESFHESPFGPRRRRRTGALTHRWGSASRRHFRQTGRARRPRFAARISQWIQSDMDSRAARPQPTNNGAPCLNAEVAARHSRNQHHRRAGISDQPRIDFKRRGLSAAEPQPNHHGLLGLHGYSDSDIREIREIRGQEFWRSPRAT
jgi:hypothetical protein